MLRLFLSILSEKLRKLVKQYILNKSNPLSIKKLKIFKLFYVLPVLPVLSVLPVLPVGNG